MANLNRLYGDARAVKRFSEELLLGLAHAVAVLGVKSVEARSDSPGLWTGRGKLASVGITVKDGFIFHGFTLNMTQDCVPGHSLIEHNGNQDCQVTSLEQEGIRLDSARDFATRVPAAAARNAGRPPSNGVARARAAGLQSRPQILPCREVI